MLDLDSARWSELTHAYGSADDIPERLRQLQIIPKSANWDSELCDDLWSSLCHQGDAYSSSFAAAPHIVLSCERSVENAPWSLPQLVICIEIARLQGRSPEPLSDLRKAYTASLARLPALLSQMHKTNPSEETAMIGAAAFAASCGQGLLAQSYLELTAEIAPKFLDWVLEL